MDANKYDVPFTHWTIKYHDPRIPGVSRQLGTEEFQIIERNLWRWNLMHMLEDTFREISLAYETIEFTYNCDTGHIEDTIITSRLELTDHIIDVCRLLNLPHVTAAFLAFRETLTECEEEVCA